MHATLGYEPFIFRTVSVLYILIISTTNVIYISQRPYDFLINVIFRVTNFMIIASKTNDLYSKSVLVNHFSNIVKYKLKYPLLNVMNL